MKLLVVFLFFLAGAARGQSDFHAYLGTEDLIEGGRVEKLTVTTSNLQFNVRPPKGWYRQVDEPGRKIIFTSLSGQSAITVQFTTNFPGPLPGAGRFAGAGAGRASGGRHPAKRGLSDQHTSPGCFLIWCWCRAPAWSRKCAMSLSPRPPGRRSLSCRPARTNSRPTRLFSWGWCGHFGWTPSNPRSHNAKIFVAALLLAGEEC